MIPLDARLELAPKVRLRFDTAAGRTMLLWPERGMALNDSAVAILRLCGDGLTVAEIIDRIASEHSLAREQASSDVLGFLEALAERGLVRARAAASGSSP